MVECSFCGEEFDSEHDLHVHWDEHVDELNSHQKDKVKKATRKHEEQKTQKMRKRKQMAGWGLAGLAALVVLALIGLQFANSTGGTSGAASINLDGQPVMGNASAPVTVVEFGDYRCPYCRQFETGEFTGPNNPGNIGPFEKLKKNFIDTGKVKFSFINFAFLGPGSTKAAVAGECVLN